MTCICGSTYGQSHIPQCEEFYRDQILSERVEPSDYQRRTQLAIDNERLIAFVDPPLRLGQQIAARGHLPKDLAARADEIERLDPRHDSFDSLMAAHRCEHCQGTGWAPLDDDEEDEGFWLPFLVLLLCAVAFVLWLFWMAAAL